MLAVRKAAARQLLQAKRAFLPSPRPVLRAKLGELGNSDVQALVLEREEGGYLEEARNYLEGNPTLVATWQNSELSEGLPTLRQWPNLKACILEDVRLASQVFEAELGSPCVDIKLEAVSGTTCPRWHIDKVFCRVLCTYVGPSTNYLPREAVMASHDRVWAALEDAALAPQTGDLLFLKGSLWAEGHGAVHRSPPACPDEMRLLLTIDGCSASPPQT